MPITRRKSVPFSKNFRVECSDFPIGFVYFGTQSWNAKNDINSRSMLLPPLERPQDYEWRMFHGCSVFGYEIGNSDLDYRKRLAYEILKAGALTVEFILHEQLNEIQINGYNMIERIRPNERYRR